MATMHSSDNIDEELRMLDDYTEDSRWLREHYNEIRKDYANKYVAVKDHHIVGADENADRLLERLRETQEDLRSVVIEFVPPEDLMLVL